MPVSFNPNATFHRSGSNVKLPTKLHNGKENPDKSAAIARQNEIAKREEANLIAKKAAAAGQHRVAVYPLLDKIPEYVPFNLDAYKRSQNQKAMVNGATAPFLSEGTNSMAGGRKRTRKLKRRSKKTRKH